MEFFKGIWEGQKIFGEVVATVINTVLLTFVYIVGVGLTTVAAKIVGKKFLEMKIDKNSKTYWEDLNLDKKEMEEYYRQF